MDSSKFYKLFIYRTVKVSNRVHRPFKSPKCQPLIFRRLDGALEYHLNHMMHPDELLSTEFSIIKPELANIGSVTRSLQNAIVVVIYPNVTLKVDQCRHDIFFLPVSHIVACPCLLLSIIDKIV